VIFGLRELHRRRKRLVARCAEQRAAVAAVAQPLVAKAAVADRVVGAVRLHPVSLTLAASAVTGLLTRLVPPWVTRVILVASVLKSLVRPHASAPPAHEH
jgi:hypothetical protein